jgi:hypothetical protein
MAESVDVKKKIGIFFSSDTTELMKDVSKLSGLSDKEAKKVGKALSGNMKKAGDAATTAAKKSKVAMKSMATSAKTADMSYKKLKRSSAELGRGFGELSMVLGETDTVFGQMAGSAGMMAMSGAALLPLFGGMRAAIVSLGTSTAMATGGLTLLAGALVAAVVSMGGVDEEADKQEKKIKALGQQYKKLNEKIQNSIIKNSEFRTSLQATIFQIDSIDREMREKKLELDFKLGKITKKQYQEFLDESRISGANERITKSFDSREKAIAKSVTMETSTLNNMRQALNVLNNAEAIENPLQMSEDTARIDKMIGLATQQSQIESIINGKFAHRSLAYRNQMKQYAQQTQLVKIAENEQSEFDKTRVQNESKIQKLSEQNILNESKLNAQKERNAKNAAARAKRGADNDARQKTIDAQRIQVQKQLEQLNKENLSANEQRIGAINKQLESVRELAQKNKEIAADQGEIVDVEKLLNALYDKREKALTEIQNKSIDNAVITHVEKEMETHRARFEDGKLGYMELIELAGKYSESETESARGAHGEILRMIEERNRKTKEGIQASTTMMGDFAGSSIQALQNVNSQNDVLMNNLFMLQRASSIAQIAFKTAENIVTAQGYPPPLNGIATGLALATAAAQTAVVMSQPSPTSKKHMGGTIGPDERNYTLLRGEAVLDRRTVSNIGGADGVRKLQQNRAGPDVIVMQPFKHFDRYLSDRKRRRGTTQKIRQGY